MNSINIKFLQDVKLGDEFNYYIKELSNSNKDIKFQDHEQTTILKLIAGLSESNIEMYLCDGMYLNFNLPYINKEFDILKVANDFTIAINIEVKKEFTTAEKIFHQLEMHHYYLNTIFKKVLLFTFIDVNNCYTISNSGLIKCSFDKIIESLKIFNTMPCFNSDLEKVFKPSDFLVSPTNDTEKFINKNYYLTDEQYQKKKEILDIFKNKKSLFATLSGKAGTGKTLLAYNIAIELAKHKQVLIMFCGNLCDGHNILNQKLENVTICPIKDIDGTMTGKYNFVIVDEVQRITSDSWNSAINIFYKNSVPILFVGDIEQYLSNTEKKNSFFEKTILNSPNNIKFMLNTKIRTNEYLIDFINKLLNKSYKMKFAVNSDLIDIVFASNENNAITYLLYYISKKYVFINFTSAHQGDVYYDSFKQYNTVNSHEAVGQEYDNVVVVINNNFGYQKQDDGSILLREKWPHPTNDYIYRKMLTQALSRARLKIAIIVVNDYYLYKQIQEIKNIK